MIDDSSPIKDSFQIGNVTLYLGDALEIMPTLPDVHCIVTDAPYKLESGGVKNAEMSGKFDPENYNNDGSIVECKITWAEIMKACFDIMPQGDAYFMCNNQHVADCINEALAAGFEFHNLLIWKKSTITPNRWYMKNCEFIVYVWSGKARAIADCGSGMLEIAPTPKSKHPTAKPVELMRLYISNSCQSDETVLDPFAGSGATLVAALDLQRNAIGIETSREWFELAKENLIQAYKRPILL